MRKTTTQTKARARRRARSGGSALELQLAKEVIECDQERLRAQMSGLPTGWEHPNTQTYFKRVLFLAEKVLAQNDKVRYHADNAGGAHGKDTNDK